MSCVSLHFCMKNYLRQEQMMRIIFKTNKDWQLKKNSVVTIEIFIKDDTTILKSNFYYVTFESDTSDST